MRPILQGAESLTGQMRTIWLLAFHLAMRAREISEARWEWIEPRDGRAWMHICARPGFDPKGTAGWVPISAPVAAELLAIRGASGAGYILGELPVTRRYDLVKRDFAAWMRRAGWARRHTAHELRAYRIHVWRRAYGLDVARDWARHRNASVTESHYSDNYNPSREPIA
jgi:integrase